MHKLISTKLIVFTVMMLLVASSGDGTQEIISPEGKNGEQVMAEGIEFTAAKEIGIQEVEKLKLKIENSRLTAHGMVLKTLGEEVKTKFVANGIVR